MARIAIDPVVGIEGQLRIEAQVEGAEVTDAWSESSRFQGIGLLLQGKDPGEAWSFVQRICGGCARSHALCSVRAVEDALQISIPENARLLRNILSAVQHIQDHVVRFYHLHALDWVDIAAALDAEPAQAARLAQSISDWPLASTDYFNAVRGRLSAFFRTKWTRLLDRGYRGHPAYRLPPEANLLVMAHYLQALDWLRDASRIQGLCGNPTLHLQTYRVGGVACSTDPDGTVAVDATQLEQAGKLFVNARDFVEKVYLRDLLLVASFYEDWAGYGAGPGNYMAYGDFPLSGDDPADLFLPAGLILGKELYVHPLDRSVIADNIADSWRESDNDAMGLGSQLWLSSPRYDSMPVEVGPLARMLVAYASGRPRVRRWVDTALAQLELGSQALFSTLGRTIAHGVEAVVLGEKVTEWLTELTARLSRGDLRLRNAEPPALRTRTATGFGWAEAPHGALCHGVQIEAGTIAHYQCLLPSAWNTSPRDAGGQRGPCEAALLYTPVADPKRPVEIWRTIHSFDPCATWTLDTGGPRQHRIGLVPGGTVNTSPLEDGEQRGG
jgi:hydrogenase large subunit